MSTVHYTINKKTGTFVRGRRSMRLAAARGEAVVAFAPRVETFSDAGRVPQKRTSPRLATMYAARAAAEKSKAEALRLVDAVLDFAAKRNGTGPAPKAVTGFTMYYDPFTNTSACCACGGGACETEMKAELDATLMRFHADLAPRIESADGTAASVEAVMVATYNHPDLPVILRAAKVKASCKRFYDTLEKKMLEYLAHPQTTLTLQLVCGAILHKYYGV
jgi:hypothetical protein